MCGLPGIPPDSLLSSTRISVMLTMLASISTARRSEPRESRSKCPVGAEVDAEMIADVVADMAAVADMEIAGLPLVARDPTSAAGLRPETGLPTAVTPDPDPVAVKTARWREMAEIDARCHL